MTFAEFVNQARSRVLLKRQDHSNVGESRVTPDTAWWQEVCLELWIDLEALKADVALLMADKTEPEEAVKRGPGRPPKVAA